MSQSCLNTNEEDCWVIEFDNLVSKTYTLNNLLLNNKNGLTDKRFVIIPYNNFKNNNYIQYNVVKTKLLDLKIQPQTQTQKIIFKPLISKQEYLEKINFLKNQIQLGNIYEINFCVKFEAQVQKLDVLSVFVKLIELSNTHYNYLVKLNNQYIICCSPELFLKKEDDLLYTKPIKGTIKRGNTNKIDEELKLQLKNSIKDKTEHVMAVDVARNDLSMIAQRGTVNVNKLYNIESYKTVHQMVTTVFCKLKENISFDQIIEATFPMASMTGAPKQKAIEIISATENFERNYYSGTFGFIKQNNDFELPVVIRSLFYNDLTGELSFAVGGAITNLSNPYQEFDECLLKAQTMINSVNGQLIWD